VVVVRVELWPLSIAAGETEMTGATRAGLTVRTSPLAPHEELAALLFESPGYDASQ